MPADDAWRRWPAAVAYLRRTLADEIVALADPAGALTPLIGSASHLLILELLAGEAEIPGTRPAIEFLLRNLPEAMIADVVKLDDVAADYKIGVLSRYVAACGRVPPGCEMVWEDRPPGGAWLLPGILARLDLPTVERLYDSAAEHHSAALVYGLVEVRNRASGAWLPLTRIVEAVDDGTLLALYHKHGGAFFQHYPADEPAMAQRLHAMLCSLPDHTDQFSLRLDVVSAGERLLPSDADHHAAGTWARVRKAVLDVGRLQGQTTRILRTPPIARIETACRQMIEAIARALPPDAFEDDLLGTRKQECLRRIGRSLLAGQPLLPPNVWQYAGLWQKATWYFQTGKWPAARLAKMRGAKGSPVKAAWIATGVVAAGLFLMATLWWSSAPPGTMSKTPPVTKKRTAPESDAAQRAAAAKAAKEKAEQEGIRQQSKAQRAAAAEAARQRAADEAARQKIEEEDAQRAAEEQSRRVAEEKARRQAEETKARTEQAAAQRAKDEAEAQAEQEHQWLAAARDFADRHRGRLLEAQPFPAGILHLPDEPDPKGDEPPRWFLGAGRLQLESSVYEFGAGFDRAPPVARHEIPELAETLGLASAGVEIRQRGQDVMIVATAVPKPIAPEAATGKKEEVKQLENKRQRLSYLLREWHKLDKIEDTEETKEKRTELRDAILGALEIKVPPAPERPTAITVRPGEDPAAAAAKAQQDYHRALAAREQVLNSVEALARDALTKLEARIRQLQAESKGELARQRDENDRAVQQLKSRCRNITAIIYQADARPAPSAELKPTPGIAQLPVQCRVEVVENAYTPTYAETAKLMVQLVPASGVTWPKWFTDDVVAICTVCEYPEEGSTRTFDLIGAVKPKAHLVIAGTQRMAVRFGFFRRTDSTGASDRLVAETSWHTVDEIKRGAEYRLKAPLTADALDKLRALTTTNKQLQ